MTGREDIPFQVPKYLFSGKSFRKSSLKNTSFHQQRGLDQSLCFFLFRFLPVKNGLQGLPKPLGFSQWFPTQETLRSSAAMGWTSAMTSSSVFADFPVCGLVGLPSLAPTSNCLEISFKCQEIPEIPETLTTIVWTSVMAAKNCVKSFEPWQHEATWCEKTLQLLQI